jgi:hypothetical protein
VRPGPDHLAGRILVAQLQPTAESGIGALNEIWAWGGVLSASADRGRDGDWLDQIAFDAAPVGPGDDIVSVVLVVDEQGASDLDRSLRSLRAQSYGALEVIVVDDTVTDGLIGTTSRADVSDDRHVIVAGPRRGTAAAREAGVAASHGRYVGFLDPGSIVHPQWIGRQVAAMQQRDLPASVALVQRFDDEGITVMLDPPRPLTDHGATLLVERTVLERLGPFVESPILDEEYVERIRHGGRFADVAVVALPLQLVANDSRAAGPAAIAARDRDRVRRYRDAGRARQRT